MSRRTAYWSHDAADFVFVPSGAAYRRAEAKKGASLPDVVLRKIDSIVTTAWSVPATDPLDLSLWAEQSIKDAIAGRKPKRVVRI